MQSLLLVKVQSLCTDVKAILNFSCPSGYMRYMKEACFEYFKLGGLAVSGPVGLLSV